MKANKVEAQQPGVILVTAEAAVVAEVENGKVYEVVRTTDGLMVCPLAELSNTQRWRKIVSLKSFVNDLPDDRYFRVRVATEPNVSAPDLNRFFFGRECFNGSGFDMICTGTSRIQLPELVVPD